MIKNDEYYMAVAIDEAKKAFESMDIPVGCVIVKDGEIIAKAHNLREKESRATAHAEIEAINGACRSLGRWRLSDCTLYVTLEPCCMCAGAIVNSRIKRVVYSVKDAKSGAFGSVIQLNSYPLNHKVLIESGIMEKEVLTLMQEFFQRLRNK